MVPTSLSRYSIPSSSSLTPLTCEVEFLLGVTALWTSCCLFCWAKSSRPGTSSTQVSLFPTLHILHCSWHFQTSCNVKLCTYELVGLLRPATRWRLLAVGNCFHERKRDATHQGGFLWQSCKMHKPFKFLLQTCSHS